MKSIVIPANADLNAASDLKEQLLIQSQTSKKITLDFKDVDNISTPFLEVLLSFIQKALETDKKVILTNVSNDTKKIFQIFGCSTQLEGMIQ
jgi:anti-anti-sigma regulatory factor